jgi:hypothetical protein
MRPATMQSACLRFVTRTSETAGRQQRTAQSSAMNDSHSHPNIREIAELLALAVSRIQARKASDLSEHGGDSSLDTSAQQSGHATSSKRRMTSG